MKETYKDIQGYEGKYQISNLGNVYSLITNKILKPRLTLDGYYQVDLCKDGVKRHLYIHRLVAQSFLDNPKNYKIVNHKDENSMNNIASNLEWCDSTYNNNYGNCKRKISEANSIKINQYDMNGNFIKQWLGINNIERCLKINKGNICMCCKGKRNNAGGYKWEYMQEIEGSDSNE